MVGRQQNSYIRSHLIIHVYRERNGGDQWWFFSLALQCDHLIRIFIWWPMPNGNSDDLRYMVVISVISCGHDINTHLANGGFRSLSGHMVLVSLGPIIITAAAALACGISSIFYFTA